MLVEKQYCRYCAFCINGDCYYCTAQERVLTPAETRRVRVCKDFALSDLGDVDSGKRYKPRVKKCDDGAKTISILDNALALIEAQRKTLDEIDKYVRELDKAVNGNGKSPDSPT